MTWLDKLNPEERAEVVEMIRKGELFVVEDLTDLIPAIEQLANTRKVN